MTTLEKLSKGYYNVLWNGIRTSFLIDTALHSAITTGDIHGVFDRRTNKTEWVGSLEDATELVNNYLTRTNGK
jgi:hypothetical protein